MKKSDWDDETAEMIKKSQIMSELNIGEGGIRSKKPAKSAKPASSEARKRALPKNAAKRKAIQQIMKTGIIPASPTR